MPFPYGKASGLHTLFQRTIIVLARKMYSWRVPLGLFAWEVLSSPSLKENFFCCFRWSCVPPPMHLRHCNPGWPRTCLLEQAGFELIAVCLCLPRAGIKGCTTIPRSLHLLCYLKVLGHHLLFSCNCFPDFFPFRWFLLRQLHAEKSGTASPSPWIVGPPQLFRYPIEKTRCLGCLEALHLVIPLVRQALIQCVFLRTNNIKIRILWQVSYFFPHSTEYTKRVVSPKLSVRTWESTRWWVS